MGCKKVINICQQCKKEYYVCNSRKHKSKFCSRKCQHDSMKKRINRVCINCGEDFEIVPSDIKYNRGKYCCRNCKDIFESGPRSPSWLGGISYGKYCPKFNKEFKERVRNYFNRICPICGETENKRKLAVHHITYDKQSCCNNKIAMFIPLCIPCHNRTNHNREFWENYLFTYINLYHDGISFLDQNNIVYYNKTG